MTPQARVDSSVFGGELLDHATLDAILDSLLDHEPPHVMAVAETGLTVDMPAGVPIRPGNVVERATTPLEHVLPSDLTRLIDAWDRAKKSGAAKVALHMRAYPERLVDVYLVDARHRYGVFLSFVVGGVDATDPGIAASEPFQPRLCTLKRDEMSVISDVDDAATKILGWTRAELIGKRTLDIMHPDDRSLSIANWMAMLGRSGLQRPLLFRYRRSDGGYVWLESTNDNQLADPAIGRIITHMVDVSDRMEAIEALRASEQLLRRLTEALPIGIVQIDAERRIVHANERLSAIVGVPTAATIDEQFALAEPAGRRALDTALRKVLELGVTADIEVTLDHPTVPRRCSVAFRALTSESGLVNGAIGCIADITESLRLREELRMRATFDMLTKCLNRAAILETLESLLRERSSQRTGLAVLFVDLNRLKQINDLYGHAVGDHVLRRVGERLLSDVGPGDFVGRLGGDEFLIVCPEVASPQTALDMAARITVSLAERTAVGSVAFDASASIGVAWTDISMDADTLVARADAAMYEAKRRAAGASLAQTNT
ncbi:MAG: sensor domain-containing diguanylate cyclase [Candidatus Eremiobacteraeota bacterium]|nr:sensor domain-containing diguanylate cyclase [Candidatus Eremiobacteraeota bacterium]